MRDLIIIFAFLILNIQLSAQQPPICGNSPAMKSFCREACIICDIDGFTGRNNSNVVGQAPPGFCTSVVHHMQWIGFIAGTTDITMEVKVSACTLNSGLEIGLYESLDCNNFRLISECDTDVRPNSTRIFKNTVPLTVGQYYYFVMDGSGNDICDWTIKVTKGSTKVLPLTATPQISLPAKVCKDEVFEMMTPGINGASFYSWIIDGAIVKNGKKVTHSLSKPGTYKICLEASNVCDKAPVNCTNIEVLPIPTSTVSQQVCFGECYLYNGKKYCQSGNYEVRLKAANGCDSALTLNLVVDDKITASTSVNICAGDTLYIGNGKLFAEGKHQVIINNQEGCNIYLEVSLKLIICNIKASFQGIPVICNGENTGQIRFKVNAGTPPFTYKGFKVENPSVTFDGKITDIDTYTLISDVDEGNYSFLIDDTYGNSRALNVFVSQPSKLKSENKTSDYSGFQISCYGLADGYLRLVPSGGISPYTFTHSFSNVLIDSISRLASGDYKSTITDANGCILISDARLRQPDSLSTTVLFSNPDCSGTASGKIVVNSVSGGVKPYFYSLNNESYTDKKEFSGLFSGNYKVTVKDANQCLTSINKSLVAAEIPILISGQKEYKIQLGDSLLLDVGINLNTYNAFWLPDDRMTCNTCISTKVLPVNDTAYEITATSKDGCQTKEIINVLVEKIRSFTMPNIFSPNNDHINDNIRIYSGNDVASINFLSIYDRWGNLIYKTENIDKGIYEIDWDSTFHQSVVSGGSYTWIAGVNYLDGKTIFHHGTILVAK